MIELAFVACMATAPTSCESRSLWFINTTTDKCTASAQAQLDKWTKFNPRWEVSNWSCDAIDTQAARL